MSKNLVCDPACVAPDACRIKNNSTVITSGFLRLNWLSNRFGPLGWRFRAWPCRRWRDGLLIDLLSRYFRPPEQAQIICGNSNLRARAKTAITRRRFIEAFRIGEGILFPRQQREPRANSIHQNVGGL